MQRLGVVRRVLFDMLPRTGRARMRETVSPDCNDQERRHEVTSYVRGNQEHEHPRGAGRVAWKSPTGGDETLGLVDFSIFPHLDHEMLPENTLADAKRWAADIAGPAYAIDDETAIKVADGAVEVVSEGHWKLFPS